MSGVLEGQELEKALLAFCKSQGSVPDPAKVREILFRKARHHEIFWVLSFLSQILELVPLYRAAAMLFCLICDKKGKRSLFSGYFHNVCVGGF
jgi:hypothetical protein